MRLGEGGVAEGKVVARIIMEGEGRIGAVEARWEVNSGKGSGLSVLALGHGNGKEKEHEDGNDASSEEKHPFADDGAVSASPLPKSTFWKEITAVKKLVSGKYEVPAPVVQTPLPVPHEEPVLSPPTGLGVSTPSMQPVVETIQEEEDA